VVLFNRKPHIDTPFLKGYVRRAKSFPSHVPAWIVPGGWGVFALLVALSIPLGSKGFGLVYAGAVAWGLVTLLQSQRKASTDEERFDERAHSVIRRLKFLFAQGVGKSIPRRILIALEEAAEAYVTAAARLAAEDPIAAEPANRQLERHLHAALVAAMPLIRDEQQSRAEWKKMRENNDLIAQIVHAIDCQTSAMLSYSFASEDRLAALSELGLQPPQDTATLPTHQV
jgi:hypothetical protein